MEKELNSFEKAIIEQEQEQEQEYEYEFEKEEEDQNGEDQKKKIYKKWYNDIVNSGMYAALGHKNFGTLFVLASFMNEKGECFPTQRKLAELMGCSRTTANKNINELLKFKWNGKPLVIRRFKVGTLGKSSSYRILPIAQVAAFNGEVEPL